MTNEQIQTLLQNLSWEDQKELSTAYNSYIKEKQAIDTIQKRLDSCEEERQKAPRPTERETEIKGNLNFAKSLPRRKRHTVNASLLGRNKITELAIDGKNFNPASLDKRDYLKMFFKLKKESVTTNYSYLILSLVSLVTAINSATFSIALGNRIFMIASLILLGVSAVGAYKHQKNKQTHIKIIPKSTVSQGQINDFVKALKKDYVKEQNHSLEMQANNTAFLDSIEDICQRRIDFHKDGLKEAIQEIENILEKCGISFTEEDIPEIQNVIQTSKQKKLTL